VVCGSSLLERWSDEKLSKHDPSVVGSVEVGVSSWEKPMVGRNERPLTSVDDDG
jgi:hypothetical protein